jgi:DNA-binding response OmpR family regulator
MEFIDEPNLVRPYSNVYEFKTLLLVDDDHQLAETLQWILAEENFLVDVAHDGDEAMLKVTANRYDAVVCDILMPHMRGDDFYYQATELRPELRSRFVLITGFGNDPKVRAFLNKSGLKCLIKPFPVKKLIDCVRGLVNAPASHCG